MSNVAMTMGQAAAASSAPAGVWDLDYAYRNDDLAWDLSTLTYESVSYSVSGQETNPTGVFFKPDGTKMYVCGYTGHDINEYNLSVSNPWIVNGASYVQNFSVLTEEGSVQDLFFKSDGTKMYIVGSAGDEVNEYDLSTAWDISTSSHLQNFSVASQETIPRGIFFKPDGTKMYIVGNGSGAVNEYDLSTAWDISTASHLQNFSVTSQDTVPSSISFKPDGTKMFVLGDAGNDVNEYTLGTAWDVSTASYVQNATGLIDTNPSGIFFKPDGSKMYVVGYSTDTVYQFRLGGFSVNSQEATPTDVFFKPDGTKMYIIGYSVDNVNEYNLSTAWDLSTASYLQNFYIGSQEAAPHAFFFKPDGTKMYVMGSSGDDVNEYDLSTAWDVSTASYLQLFSVSTQELAPTGLFFKSDGTKMYVVGSNGDDVNEYNLSTAWNVSTASYAQNFSVSTEDTIPTGIFFKPDGTKMFVLGQAGQDANEYSLSTAWDISTASYAKNFSFSTELTSPQGIHFKPDGSKMYVVCISRDRVYSYTLLDNQ